MLSVALKKTLVC